MKNLGISALILLSISVFFISCTAETSKDELLIEKVDDIVWTRGTNFKSFQSEPFRLFIVEDGICVEFSEGDNLVRGNKISYTIEQSTTDTLKLGYRVEGNQINHCGTFTYYMDTEGENLIRTYKECNASIYGEVQRLSFYQANNTLDEVCVDVEN